MGLDAATARGMTGQRRPAPCHDGPTVILRAVCHDSPTVILRFAKQNRRIHGLNTSNPALPGEGL